MITKEITLYLYYKYLNIRVFINTHVNLKLLLVLNDKIIGLTLLRITHFVS